MSQERERSRSPSNAPVVNDECKLYIGNLPFEVKDHDITAVFNRWGNVLFSEVIINRETNRSRGFGFVAYQHVNEAETALHDCVNGIDILGRQATVTKSIPKGERGSSDRGRGGGRGGLMGGRGYNDRRGGGYDDRRGGGYDDRRGGGGYHDRRDSYDDRREVYRGGYNDRRDSYDDRRDNYRGGGYDDRRDSYDDRRDNYRGGGYDDRRVGGRGYDDRRGSYDTGAPSGYGGDRRGAPFEGRGGGTNPAGGYQDRPPRNPKQCFDFQRGNCAYGDSCRYSHSADAVQGGFGPPR